MSRDGRCTWIPTVDDQRHSRGKSVGIDHLDAIKEAAESGLIRRPGIDCNFDATRLSGRVVVDVEVGGFVEAMEGRSRAGRCEVRMQVGVPG
jgi:hypothetical protein